MGKYFRDIWEGIITVLIGMKITWLHLFTPAVTIQYPGVKLKLPERARNRLYVNMDDCIGCDQCSMACPVDCLTIKTIKSTPDIDLGLTSVGTKKRLYVPQFDIDIAKCCYCGLCVDLLPPPCLLHFPTNYSREMGEVSVRTEGVKQKTRPNTGREFDSRGSTRFVPRIV